MTRTLQQDIKQRQAFSSPEQEAYLNIVRTASELTDAMELALRDTGITLVQYNVLRILRGAEPDGLCRNELRDRLLNRMPDVTRLLDRLEEAGLVSRTREEGDKRQVRTRLTSRAATLLGKLDRIVATEHERLLGHMPARELTQLSALLTRVRNSR